MWAQAPGIMCSKLAEVTALGAGLEKLQALTSLHLDFLNCSGYVGAGPKYPVLAAQRQSAKTFREQGRLRGGARSVIESGRAVDKVRTAQQS